MNKRIREFARISHIDVYALGKDREKWEATLEKFSEMIIQECTDICKNNIIGTYSTDGAVYNRGVLACADSITKHFGVDRGT